jgi:nucleotide-binding universal stress UspA family protein
VHGAGRVIVGASGSPGSLRALRHGEALARAAGVLLIPVIAWQPPGGDRPGRARPPACLCQQWQGMAGQRLQDALTAAWGELPADPTVQPHVERGPAGWVLVNLACRPDDLLVVGPAAAARPVRSLLG